MSDEPQFTLHGFFRSSASYRARIALELKGVNYQYVAKRLGDGAHRAADFLALNPQGLVPVLEHGDFALLQSLAIIEYLDDVEPWPALLPADPGERATVRAMAQIVACEMHPLCNLRVLSYLRESLGNDEADIRGWYRHWMAAGFEALDALIARHGDGRHCFGGSVTLADVCLVPQVFNARRFDCDLTPFGHVTAAADALSAHPAFAAAHPDRQPDATA
jgi:maleylacetoacetate isomerase